MRFPLIVVGMLGAVAACVGGAHVPPPRAAAPSPSGVAADGGVGRSPAVVAAPAPPRPARDVTLPPLERDAACALTPVGVGRVSGDKRPFRRADGTCGPDPFCNTADRGPRGGDACFVANDNIARAERESRGAGPGRAVAAAPGGAIRWLDRVDAHLHLDPAASAALAKDRFVVLEGQRYGSYAVAFHDVFQEQLPVYVSADAILNAVYQATQTLLEEAERTRLVPTLAALLPRLRRTLAAARGAYAAEVAGDLDLYLGVAEALLDDEARVPAAAAPILEAARQAEGLAEVSLFGRDRMVDFGQLAPRGYYARAEPVNLPGKGDAVRYVGFDHYFRAMMWLSRLELNLVSRSCRSSQPGEHPDPTETPREARLALALADLVRRAGAEPDLATFERVYATFAGRREDVSVPDLLGFAIPPGDPAAPEKLRAKIGAGFVRTARTHYMPDGAKDLPVIATLFGPRITPDAAPLTSLVNDAIPGRTKLGAADVAYVLGHDRAKGLLAADLARYPALPAALDRAREAMAAGARARPDVYGTWLRALGGLAAPIPSSAPAFMRTPAFADARMSSALAGYAQLRHTFVLLTGQGYDSYGCEIPDGWVEPALATYDALVDWAAAGRAAVPTRAAYFDRVTQILGMLRAISRAELAGTPLAEPQRRWLGMISEHTPRDGYSDSGMPPKYTGWYFDLFPDRHLGAERDAALVADYFTLTNEAEVRYLGVQQAALGVFVVDTGGPPRAMVGPVAIPYETTSPLSPRLDDAAARTLPHPRAPWLGYVIPAPEEPTLEARLYTCGGDARVVVRAPTPLGEAKIELLDHHGDPLGAAVTHAVGPEPTAFAFALPKALLGAKHGVEGFHLALGDFHAVSNVSVYEPYDPNLEPDPDQPRRTKHQLLLGRIATTDDPTPWPTLVGLPDAPDL